MRLLVLYAALVPYIGFVAVDARMHEKARRVPRTEQWLHGGIIVTLGTFFVLAFSGANIFYDALLPEVAPADKLDRVSAMALAMFISSRASKVTESEPSMLNVSGKTRRSSA